MPQNNPKTIAIYGGAFDPVHEGHLRCAESLQKTFAFDNFVFVPCKIPLLKNPTSATAQQRVKMLELVLSGKPDFSIDQREINRDSPSYMIETLKSFHHDFPDAALILIMGADAFQKLPLWHQWQDILNFCHILIMDRAEIDTHLLSEDLIQLLEKHQAASIESFFQKKTGCILSVNAGHYSISSTEIRKRIKEGRSLAGRLPAKLEDYIRQNKLYL